MRTKRKMVGLATAALLAGSVATSVAIAPAASASTTVSGTIQCLTMPVEGVWVAAQSGSSGWATVHHTSNSKIVSWSYKLTSGNSYVLDVGCGGSQQNWAVSLHSATLSGSGHSLWCYDYAYEDPYYGQCR